MDIDNAAAKIAQLRNPQPETKEPIAPIEDVAQGPETPDEVVPDEVEQEFTPERATSERVTEKREEGAEAEAETYELGAEDFANILKIKPELLNVGDEGVSFKVDVDGESLDVPLEKLVNAFRGDAHLTNRSKKIAELEKKAESQLVELVEKANQTAQLNEFMVQEFEKLYLDPFNSINWNQLRDDDPVEWNAKRLERDDARNKLQMLREASQKALMSQQQEINHKMQAYQQSYLQEQAKILTESLGWNETMATEVTKSLKDRGYQDNEISQIADARFIQLAHDAMKYREGKKNLAEKVSKPIPKILKPGKSPTKGAVKSEGIKQAKEEFKKSGGSVEAAANLIKQMYK